VKDRLNALAYQPKVLCNQPIITINFTDFAVENLRANGPRKFVLRLYARLQQLELAVVAAAAAVS